MLLSLFYFIEPISKITSNFDPFAYAKKHTNSTCHSMQQLARYFSQLTELQTEKFQRLGPLYQDWNQKINLISRKDIDHLYDHHILHSLAVAKIITFQPGARILDLGTGGGLPGIPLAILFPETEFFLIDARQKKIKVVQDIATQLQLPNVTARHTRVEDLKKEYFDFVVSRAVAKLDQLFRWSQRLYAKQHLHALPNGLIALKGGKINAELNTLPKGEYSQVYPLSNFFEEEYYREKYAIYVQGA